VPACDLRGGELQHGAFRATEDRRMVDVQDAK
jgi:hypothetical protein